MSGILVYCRAGFENDCAAELQDKTAALGVFGYCQTTLNSGYVVYRCQPEEADHLGRKLALRDLVFARQFIVIIAELAEIPATDRVSTMQMALMDEQLNENFAMVKPAGDLRVETPGGEQKFFYVTRGVLEVQPHLVTVLADSAMHGSDLDEEAARVGKETAEQRLAGATEQKDLEHARMQLVEAAARYRAVQKLKGRKA